MDRVAQWRDASTKAALAANKIRALFGDHQRCSIGVAGSDRWHDGCVDHP